MRKIIKVFLVFLVFNFVLVQSRDLLRKESHESDLNQIKSLNNYSSSGNAIGAAIVGFIFGPILFLLSFICIWKNQRKAALDYHRVQLASDLVNQINPFNPIQVQRAHGKLTYVTGKTNCNEDLVDPQSGINLRGAIRMQRSVEVKQYWIVNNNQTRQVKLGWSAYNTPHPGQQYFNDPKNWFLKSFVLQAKRVALGNYILNENQKQNLTNDSVYIPTQQQAYNIASKSNGRVPILNGKYLYFPAIPGSIDSPGTLRVKYDYCAPGQTSVIAQTYKNSFVPFRIDKYQNGGIGDQQSNHQNCNYCCCLFSDCCQVNFSPIQQIDMIAQTTLSYQQMMESKKRSINKERNTTRILSYLLMTFSICAFLSPITATIGFIPLIGGILSNAASIAIFIAALILCLPLFLLTVSICWLFFHPKVGLILLGIGLLVAGAVLAITLTNKGRNQNDAQNTVQAAKHLTLSLQSFL